MERYKLADEKMTQGFDYLLKNESKKACDKWLEAWEDIKTIMAAEGIKDINELQKKYEWSEFLSNYVQDLEAELHNAGLEDKEYFRKRIQYCEEMLELYGTKDSLVIENTRRAIADSHYELGNEAECDRLYGIWLEEDPDWGYGYIGWSDCYQYKKGQTQADLEKAEAIIAKALDRNQLRDRPDAVDRAIDIYRALGNEQKVAELKREVPGIRRNAFTGVTGNSPVTAVKTGRNNPCPCGSGKKYKKCCGKM